MTEHTIPNNYIIVFKSDASDEQCTSHCTWAHERHTSRLGAFSTAEASQFAGVKHTYDQIPGFRGYAGSFDDETKAEIEAADEVIHHPIHPPVP